MDDQELLNGLHRLEKAAFATTFDRYYRRIFGYCYHHIGHVQAAEDIAGRVFMRLLQSCHAGSPPRTSLKAWLFRVAHNLIVDDTRREKHRNHATLEDTFMVAGVEAQTEINLLAEHVRAALDNLSDAQRDVIILRFLSQMSVAETADIIGKSESAVKVLQHRALNCLREILGELEHE